MRDGVVRWHRQDLQRRMAVAFGVVLHQHSVGKQLASLGFLRLSLRPQHPKSDPQAAFKKTSARRVRRRSRRGHGTSPSKSGSKSEPGQETVRGTAFPANARVGQQGTLTRIRVRHGTRPRAPRDTRSLEPVAFAGSLFGAVCPARGTAAGLVLPFVNTAAMSAHLAEIARSVAPFVGEMIPRIMS